MLVKRVVTAIASVLLLPFRLWINLRRSMTTTSVTLLLMSIVTLNVVWGYPWVGMFAACIAISSVGAIVNRFFRPAMRVDIKLPLSVPATQTFQAQIHLTNRRRVPAIDLRVGFDAVTRRTFLWPRSGSSTARIATNVPLPMSLIRSQAHSVTTASLCFSDRGIHVLPQVVIESSFPFHLFRTFSRVKSTTSIAITPRPLATSDAKLSLAMTKAADEMTSRLCAGDSLEYTGSREYQVGIPVRRWDFGSWARLGKPIVREYQTAALKTIWLLVDTASEPDRSSRAAAEDLERVLSCAAAVIPEWLRRKIRLRMYVTSESLNGESAEAITVAPSLAESLQIRLAVAGAVDSETSNRKLLEVSDLAGHQPMLLLTSRSRLIDEWSRISQCKVALCRADLNDDQEQTQ